MNAKEMFDNLGYTQVEETIDKLIYTKPNPDTRSSFNFQVVFNLQDKTFSIADDWGDGYSASLTLLEAIVFQVKELNWL
jgi:hypothetical protein